MIGNEEEAARDSESWRLQAGSPRQPDLPLIEAEEILRAQSQCRGHMEDVQASGTQFLGMQGTDSLRLPGNVVQRGLGRLPHSVGDVGRNGVDRGFPLLA